MSANRDRRLAVYVLMALVLFAGLIIGPRAWATPTQSRPGQEISVPTRTPVREWTPPTSQPADTPRPSEATPIPSPVRATATLTPIGAPTAIASIAPTASVIPPTALSAAAALMLTKQANRVLAWRGQTVTFTLVLTNNGQASARQVSLEDTLPDGLAPGLVRGTEAAWDGRILRAQTPVLPPGGQLVVTFDAVVGPNARVGGLLVNTARAAAAAGLSASAEAYVVLPPAELPAVGGH